MHHRLGGFENGAGLRGLGAVFYRRFGRRAGWHGFLTVPGVRLDPQIRTDAWAIRPAVRADRPADGAASGGVRAAEACRDRVVCSAHGGERGELAASGTNVSYWRYLRELNEASRVARPEQVSVAELPARSERAAKPAPSTWPRLAEASEPQPAAKPLPGYDERPPVRPGMILDVFA